MIKFNKILVIRNDKIGDMALSSGVFKELRKKFPLAKITVITSPENKQIIEKNKSIDKIILLKSSPRKVSELRNYLRTSRILRKENYDAGIDLRGSFFNALLMRLARVKYRVGFYEQNISRNLLNYAYKRDKNKHETFLIQDLINKSLKMNIKNYWPDIQTDIGDERKLSKFIKENKLKKYICLCPDASDERKQWGLEKFDCLIKNIKKQYPSYKIILGGADDKKINFLKEKNISCIPLIRTNLRLVYLIFKKSLLVVSPDGGLVHLAWTSKTRTLSLIPSYIKSEHVKPLGKNSAIITGDIQKISVQQVYSKIKRFL